MWNDLLVQVCILEAVSICLQAKLWLVYITSYASSQHGQKKSPHELVSNFQIITLKMDPVADQNTV